MRSSILIVSKNRKDALQKTIDIVMPLLDTEKDEFLIFLDGCTDGSSQLKKTYSSIKWILNDKSVGASKARNILYKKAKGNYFIGLDDDAHPLQNDFVEQTIEIFNSDETIGAITFQEIRGAQHMDGFLNSALQKPKTSFYCSEFVGCGFAIRKDVYTMTNGFPTWVDIYGEEACVSLEIISKDFNILWTNNVIVHHRVDKINRANKGRNYFRFEKHLRNVSLFYCVYYRNPFLKLGKLYIHNFRKYALTDGTYFKGFFVALTRFFIALPQVIKHREPIDKKYINKRNQLANPGF